MCGIFAAVSLGESFDKKDFFKFKKNTDLVSYRGPDAWGYKTFNESDDISDNSFNIFFGHRRLSIIDLSTDGNQPMKCNGVTIIYNGEIFNYLELRDELRKHNVQFNTNSDTEVILKIYETFGTQGFNKLNGMWAFIIYDSNKKIIIASRDRFSIKPLFWTKVEDKIFFASEIKQLIPFLLSIDINKQILSLFLLQGLLDTSSETFFKGIKKLEAKSNLIIDLQTRKITTEQYWNYEHQFISENEVYERFLELFYDCVRLRLRSDVELGALLSGGLDSSAISIIGREIAGDNFRTFTVISDNEKFNEEKFVDIIIQAKNIKNKKLLLESSTIKDKFDKVLYHQDEPFAGFSMIAQYAILEKIKNETDITVVLSGQGGDEILLGYLRYYFFYLKKLYASKDYFKLMKESIASILYRTVITQWRLSAAKRYMQGMITNDKKFLLINTEPEKTWNHLDMTDAQINDIDKYSVPILTRYEDRNSMAHSLETRLPFLDHRLVEFLLSLKIQFKIKNGWNKYVLRKSFKEMPSSIRWRRDKKGFTVPEEDWLKKDFKEDIIFNFKNSFLEKAGIIRSDYFLNYYGEYLGGNKRIHEFDISRVYIAEKWMKNYFS